MRNLQKKSTLLEKCTFTQSDFETKIFKGLTLTSGVNFIKILQVRFLQESKLRSFYLITFSFAIFWRQNIGKKVTRKMLMKLTPGWKGLKYKSQKLSLIIFTWIELFSLLI